KMYETMRRTNPDFFIHSGDQIYADGPIKAEVALEDGTTWRNVTSTAKSKVAESVEEFRGNLAYHLLADNKRRFAAEVPLPARSGEPERCHTRQRRAYPA